MVNDEKVLEKWFKKCDRDNLLPWKYDFKYEILAKDEFSTKAFQDEPNPVKRLLLCWQQESLTPTGVEKTALAQSIFSILWGFDSKNPNRVDVDVMNSFWTSYKFAINSRYDVSYKKWYNTKISFDTMQELLKEYDNYIEINELFSGFAGYTHTIGNFIVESKGFNMGRKNDDYWDLALIEAKTYFDLLDEGIWEIYINKMYLQSFVNKNYNISALWEGHLTSKTTKPSLTDDRTYLYLITEFLNHVCASIEERGKLMIKSLCERTGQIHYTFYENYLKHLTPQYSDDLWQSPGK